nr:ROK family protein [Pelagibacterium xiamenense]
MPDQFHARRPDDYLLERIETMAQRNEAEMERLGAVALSVQGMLGPMRRGLKWSPIPDLAGVDLLGPIATTYGVPTHLYKRGHLMADGTRWLHPALAHATYATIFIGATVGMGLSFPSEGPLPADIGTEFGHMNHMPDGALCRCGAHGCIEAYAADYGILRAAYSVPEHTTPANAVPPGDFQQIIARARAGDRNAIHAFNNAGRALGFGINRLMSVVEISHIVLLGPGTAAFDLMRPALEDATLASLSGRINGVPQIILTADAGEPIYRGLMMKALTALDHDHFAPMTGTAARSIAE